MAVKLTEGEKTVTGGAGIEVTANKVINLLLRDENNLIKINGDNEVYTDLQLEDVLATTDTLPVGVTTGRVLQADGWVKSGTMLCFKTTSGDYVTRIYGDDGKLYIDNGTGTFKQIYLKSEVDALFTQLRGELATVAFTGEYNDLLHKPTLGTASSRDVGTNPGNVPEIGLDGKLPSSILPAMAMHAFTVATKNDLTTLSDAVAGDIGFVEDENQSYILVREPYSTLANWQEYSAVNSVNGYRGVVNLVTDDIPVQGTNNMYVNSNEKNTWNAKLGTNDVATVALTGSYSDLINKPAIPAGQIQSDWAQNNQSAVDYIKNKPTIDATLSTSSTNAIQNGAVATAINTINGDIGTIQGDITTIQGNITSLGSNKQDKLVSGTNIKTVNNNSLLGSGNVSVQDTLVSGTNIKTIGGQSLLGSGDIDINALIGANINTLHSETIEYVTWNAGTEDFSIFTAPTTTSYAIVYIYSNTDVPRGGRAKIVINSTEYSIPNYNGNLNSYVFNCNAGDVVKLRLHSDGDGSFKGGCRILGYIIFGAS